MEILVELYVLRDWISPPACSLSLRSEYPEIGYIRQYSLQDFIAVVNSRPPDSLQGQDLEGPQWSLRDGAVAYCGRDSPWVDGYREMKHSKKVKNEKFY